MKIWMADLTYTQQTLSSDVFPAGVAGLLEYAKQKLDMPIQAEVFKFPDNLSQSFHDDKPDIIGFSNYVWNCNLSLAFAKIIKKTYPNIPIIMGGPNFPVDHDAQKEFLLKNNFIDFYIFKEGEEGWVKLIELIHETKFDKASILKKINEIPNLAAISEDGELIVSRSLNRLTNVSGLSSPYTAGTLDKFFGTKLLPIIQTNRGCPFTCTFCTEGQKYWTKVRKKSIEDVKKEIAYIVEKITSLPEDKKRFDLYISDSNFGMFEEDLETCSFIGEMQEKYGYPKYISVTTGKNKRERVLEAAKLVNGAIRLSGSVQSLDKEVLTSIKRKNISADKLLDIAKAAQGVKANVVSEVILGLPSDSKEKHFDTLRKLVDSSFTTIAMYQLMMLPGTEMNVPQEIEKYGLKTKYRILPRCFGHYKFLEDEVISAEIEEIAVENSTLSFQDYLDCRKLNLIINIFYNGGVFEEIVRLLEYSELSPFGWLETINETMGITHFDELVNDFIDETKTELWESKDKLVKFAFNKQKIQDYIDGNCGNNLIQKYKALSITLYFDSICQLALSSLKAYLIKNSVTDKPILDLAEEIIMFKHYKMVDIFNSNYHEYEHTFKYDVRKIKISDAQDNKFNMKKIKFKNPTKFKFSHSIEQKTMIKNYVSFFGNDTRGLAKMLTRIYLKQFFREASPINNNFGFQKSD